MAKKIGRPSWFKMFLHQKAIVDSVDDETAGKALKAVFQYFDTGEIAELEQEAFIVFSAIKPYIDESFVDFNTYSAAGKKGMNIRWGKSDNPLITPFNPLKGGITPSNDTEADAETDTEAEEDCCCFPAAAEKSKFVPPTIEEIRAYCANNDYTFDAAHFERYYRAKGWMLGNTPMQDWKAVADSWQQKENKPKHTPFPDVPTL